MILLSPKEKQCREQGKHSQREPSDVVFFEVSARGSEDHQGERSEEHNRPIAVSPFSRLIPDGGKGKMADRLYYKPNEKEENAYLFSGEVVLEGEIEDEKRWQKERDNRQRVEEVCHSKKSCFD